VLFLDEVVVVCCDLGGGQLFWVGLWEVYFVVGGMEGGVGVVHGLCLGGVLVSR